MKLTSEEEEANQETEFNNLLKLFSDPSRHLK